MTTALKLRRGTTTQHNTFTGAAGEVTVDTTKKTVVVHDGSTAGGTPLAKEATVTSSLVAKLDKAGGTMTGDLTIARNTWAKISVQAADTGNDRNATLELLSSGNGGSIVELIYGDTDTTPGTKSPLVFKGYHDGALTERMRLDEVGNLKFNSGYGSVATAYGCRAWVNFNGTGTVAIRASGNVSSITDNGTGQYTVNFATAFPDANYCVSALAGYNNYITAVVRLDDVPAQSTTALKLECAELGGATADTFQFNVAIFR